MDDLQEQRDRSDYETDYGFTSSVDLTVPARLALLLVHRGRDTQESAWSLPP